MTQMAIPMIAFHKVNLHVFYISLNFIHVCLCHIHVHVVHVVKEVSSFCVARSI